MQKLNFGQALEALKAGKKVARAAFINQNISHLYLVKGSTFVVDRPPHPTELFGRTVTYSPHIDAFYHSPGYSAAKGDLFARVWSPTMEDILAEDWSIRD